MTVGEGIEARPSERSAMARLRASAIVLAFLALVALGAPQLPPYYLRIADNVLIYLILAMGLNMVVGYAGLLDLGFIAFYAIGAYSYAILASGQFDIHLPFVAVFPDRWWTCRALRRAAWHSRPALARRLSGYRNAGIRRDHPARD